MENSPTTIYQLKYVSDFRCDSSKCKQNCCQIYSIWIEDYDYEFLNTNAPDIAKTITREDGKYLVPSNDDACIFLKNGLCAIHATYGENTIPEVCYTYPRLYFKIDNKVYVTSNLLCDYIIKLIYSSSDSFRIVENTSTRIPKYIEEQKQYTEENFKYQYKNNLINLYIDVLKLLDNENLSSIEIVTALIELANKLDKNPKSKWQQIINNHINNFNTSQIEKTIDNVDQNDKLNTIIDIFIDIYNKSKNMEALSVLTKIKENITQNTHKLDKEKDDALKTYLKIKLSENFFPINAWYSCMTEISMLVSGYIMLREAIYQKDSFSIEDITNYITSIELAMLIYRSDVFEVYYAQKINSYTYLKSLIGL